jgi:arylamine N-acetyltransferase
VLKRLTQPSKKDNYIKQIRGLLFIMYDLYLYLNTIGLSGSFHINSLDDFALLANKHFQVFPFTNLGTQVKRSVRLDEEDLFYRLQNEGFGNSFHHHATFYLALNALGIKTTFISALMRKSNKPNDSCELESHVALVVQWNDKSYLFDLSLNGATQRPMPLNYLISSASVFVVPSDKNHYSYTLTKLENGRPIPIYDFNATPIQLSELRNGYDYSASKYYFLWSTFLYSQTAKDGKTYSLVGKLDGPTTLSVYSVDGKLLGETEYAPGQPFLKALEGQVAIPEAVTQTIKDSKFTNPAMQAVFNPIPTLLGRSIFPKEPKILIQGLATFTSHL